jgi:SsrA-binding protein
MAKKKSATGHSSSTIALNKKARHDYFIEERFEAGLSLQGWEVKSLRESHVQLTESYVLIKDNQAWLLGMHISPLPTTSTHIKPDPVRTRRLLLHRRELDRLIGAVERKGFTLIPLAMYWKHGRAKLEIALARAAKKEQDWNRDKQRILRGR